MKNIVIVGTSHVAAQSMQEVTEAIEKEEPTIIALELDRNRLHSLLSESKEKGKVPIKQIGLKGWLFYIIAQWAQEKIGKSLGVVPGIEMKTAIKLAAKNQIRVALIDQDIRLTLKKLSKNIKWKEKWNFFVDLITGPFTGKKQLKKLGMENLDLTKVPKGDLIEKLLERVKDRYPGLYYTLVEERNQIMAARIKKLLEAHPEDKILVVIGAGHKKGIEEILSKDI